MATRRQVAGEKNPITSEPQFVTPSSPATNSNISPAVPTSIILKLLFFTFLMITAPISTFFIARDLLFQGNSSWAGALAALVANVVLIGYVVVALLEDQGDEPNKKQAQKSAKGE